MVEINYDHPLQELMKSTIEHDVVFGEEKGLFYSIRMNNMNPYYSFSNMDADDEDQDSLQIINKTIDVLKFFIDNNMDIIIEMDNGANCSVETLLDIFENDKEKANKLILKIYFSFRMTDNNKKIINDIILKIQDQLDDCDVELKIASHRQGLIFDRIAIPYYFVLDDSVHKKMSKVKDYFKDLASKMNEALVDEDFSVDFSFNDYRKNAIPCILSVKEKKESASFSDYRRKRVVELLDQFVLDHLKVRQKTMILNRNHLNKPAFRGFSFWVAENQNKELFDVSVC